MGLILTVQYQRVYFTIPYFVYFWLTYVIREGVSN